MSVSGCAGLRAREHCESAACTQTPQKSPTKSVGKQQSYVPQLVVDGTVKAVTFPSPPPSLQSPFAAPTAGVNLELMSSLLMQSPRRTHRQQPSQQAQHQRSLSAEAPRVKLASELERSRTGGYLDRAFMASLSTVPRYCPSLCCGSTCMHALLLHLMLYIPSALLLVLGTLLLAASYAPVCLQSCPTNAAQQKQRIPELQGIWRPSLGKFPGPGQQSLSAGQAGGGRARRS